MNKRIYVNFLAVVLSIFPIVAQAFAFYVAPIFYGIYNYFVCKNIKEMMKMYLISLVSQLLGLSLANYFMYVASSDYNDFAETPALLIINLIFTLIIDSAFIIVKFLRNRRDRKSEV